MNDFEQRALDAGGHLADDVAFSLLGLEFIRMAGNERDELYETLRSEDPALD